MGSLAEKWIVKMSSNLYKFKSINSFYILIIKSLSVQVLNYTCEWKKNTHRTTANQRKQSELMREAKWNQRKIKIGAGDDKQNTIKLV